MSRTSFKPHPIGTTRYHQVYVTLRGWISDGSLPAGAQLPAEHELCATFGVSRITIRRAVDDLVNQGLVRRLQGKGTFVEATAQKAVSADLSGLTARVSGLGKATEVMDLSAAWITADVALASFMEISVGESVHKSSRVRAAGNERLGLVTVWLPAEVGKKVEASGFSDRTVLEAIEACGFVIGRGEQVLGATLAGVETARSLQIGVGTPLVRLQRIIRDEEGTLLERVEALWRADRYEYRMELTRGQRAGLPGWIPD